MQIPSRGDLTSETTLQVLWDELSGINTGGAAIDSYNLRWDAGVGVWDDVTGEDGNYQLDLFYVITSGVTGGETYQITVRAHNAQGWGAESPILSIVAASNPDQPDPPTTFINNIFVKVQWSAANSSGSTITAYKVFIQDSNTDFLQETTYCDGSMEPVLSQLYCEVPMGVLVLSPYSLPFDAEVVAKV
jgi:hypothetical protein